MKPTLPFPPASNEHLDISSLETWLWDAACIIRGATDAPKFKDFILPLIFYKRLSDVFDDEFATYVEQFGDEETAHAIVKADHEDALKHGRQPIVRFYIPAGYSWATIRNHPPMARLASSSPAPCARPRGSIPSSTASSTSRTSTSARRGSARWTRTASLR